MLEWIDTQPDVSVQESEYRRLLGFPANHVLEGRSRELAGWAREWYQANGRPWIYARQTDQLELEEARIRIDGAALTPVRLRNRISASEAHSVVLVAVTAGRECERMAQQLWEESKPDEYFFMETFGSAVVEHLVTTTGARLCAWAEQAGMAVLPHDSPGYPGWDILEQAGLWKLIQTNRKGALPGEIQVLPSGMLQPKKSLLAVFAITRHVGKARSFASLVPCEECSIPRCQYRRAPYRTFPRQLEAVPGPRPSASGKPRAGCTTSPVLNHEAKYSVNSRALRKWSGERLSLGELPDGSVEARFRYEGTTCSNLGQPLAYDYFVKLAPSAQGYRILETKCQPAPGDNGHKCMCEYLREPEKLGHAIAEEKPLLGRPLQDVLTWQRLATPAGCYCDAAARDYKWGLVFEVIHYALVQHEQNGTRSRQTTAILK